MFLPILTSQSDWWKHAERNIKAEFFFVFKGEKPWWKVLFLAGPSIFVQCWGPMIDLWEKLWRREKGENLIAMVWTPKNSMQQRASGQQYFTRFVCLCRWKLLWEAVQRSGTYFGAKYGKHKMKRLQDGQPWVASWHMEPYDQEGEIRITTHKPSEMVLFRVKAINPTSIIWRVWVNILMARNKLIRVEWAAFARKGNYITSFLKRAVSSTMWN